MHLHICQQKIMQTNNFGIRLKSERERLKLTQEALAEAGGVKKLSQSKYENGERSPNSEYLERLASTGVDVAYLLTGQRPEEYSNEYSNQQPAIGRHKRQLSGSAPSPKNEEDTIYIPLLSATGSMGPGSDLVTADVVMGDVPVSRHWLQMNLPRHRPQALRLVHAYGDSMRGTLDSGDFALVDTDVHTIAIDGVYVLEAHDRLFIKRVRQRMDGQYEVSSDNPSIKQTDVLDGDHQIRICGMVVYGWNGRRF